MGGVSGVLRVMGGVSGELSHGRSYWELRVMGGVSGRVESHGRS